MRPALLLLALLAAAPAAGSAQTALDSLEQRLVYGGAAAKSTVTQITALQAYLRQLRARLVESIPDGWTVSAPLMADDHTPDPGRRRAVWLIPFDSTRATRVMVLDSLGRVVVDSTYTGGLPIPVPAPAPDSLSGAPP